MTKKERQNQIIRRSIFGGIFIVLIAMAIITEIVPMRTAEVGNETYYHQYHIQSGDTLWNVAEQYKPDDCDDVRDFVKEIAVLNNISINEHITDQKWLVIPLHEGVNEKGNKNHQ